MIRRMGSWMFVVAASATAVGSQACNGEANEGASQSESLTDTRPDGEKWIAIAHPIEAGSDGDGQREFSIREGGAKKIRVHFVDLEARNGATIRVIDEQGRTVSVFREDDANVYSKGADGWSLTVLVEANNDSDYRFRVDRYEVLGGCQSDAECGVGNECRPVQCIRAPCFDQCSARARAYRPVTLEMLDQHPEEFAGDAIEVVAPATLSEARCTLRWCSEANACCNRCSADAAISTGSRSITLIDPENDAFHCSGFDCNYQEVCSALPWNDQKAHRFDGTLSLEPSPRLVIDAWR